MAGRYNCPGSPWPRRPPISPQILKDGVEEEQLAGTAALDPCGPDGPPISPQILKDGVEEEQLAGTATLDPYGPDSPPR